MYLIALDIGSSFIKAGLLDLQLKQIRHVQRVPFPPFIQNIDPVFREVDPLAIVTQARKQIHRLLDCEPGCSGILMCSQMHGMVLMDKSQQPLSNFISWQDQRSLLPLPNGHGTYFDFLSDQLTLEEKRELGNEMRPGYAITNLFWMVQNNKFQDIGGDGRVTPSSLPDFVASHISGSAPCIEPSLAAAHGAYDLKRGQWHASVLGKLGLSGLNWPKIVPTGSVAYHAAEKGKAIPIYTPIGDQQCALAGAFLKDGELSINISTGSQISRISGQVEPGNFQVRPFFDGHYLNTITHIPAGRALNALVGLVAGSSPNPWGAISQAVESVDKTDLKVDLSFFPCTTGSRGGITNISEGNLTIGHLFYAAYQDMAEKYASLAQRLSPIEKPWSSIVFSGGLAQKNTLLRNLICRKFNLPHRLSECSEDTILGLLCLSLVFTAKAPTIAVAAKQIQDAQTKEVS